MIKLKQSGKLPSKAQKLSNYNPRPGETYCTEDGRLVVLVLDGGKATHLVDGARIYNISDFDFLYIPCDLQVEII